jgi:hypothetical protein
MSVCPHGTTRVPMDGFSLHLIFENISKLCGENSGFFNLKNVTGTLQEAQLAFIII